MSFEFAWWWVFFCLPLPLLFYWLLPPTNREEPALRLSTYHALGEVEHSPSSQTIRWPMLLLIIVWLLTVIAAARPLWIGKEIQMPATGRDLLIAVDISGSMKVEDMVVNGTQIPRITAVKDIVGDFVSRRKGDRLGLVLFGTNAYLHVPLTFDRNVVTQQLHEAQLGFAGEKTAIGDAIGIAVKRLKDRPADSRVVVLLTDGANTAGEVDPKKAADLAKTAGVKIHTIGLGADSMSVRNFVFTRTVNPSTDLDEKTLTYIAEQTGGQYFRARNPEQLEAIYDIIDKLEPIELEDETYRPSKELFFWPLGTAILLAFFSLAVQQLIRRFPATLQLQDSLTPEGKG